MFSQQRYEYGIYLASTTYILLLLGFSFADHKRTVSTSSQTCRVLSYTMDGLKNIVWVGVSIF